MSTREVPEAKPAAVVVAGFTPEELTEIRRGLVQRLTVAQSNLRDRRNQDDLPGWRDIYETCWRAYTKVVDALTAPSVEPPCDDEFAYLSRPVED